MNAKYLTFIILIFLTSSYSYAFDNKLTHPDISERAIKYSQLDDFLANQLGFYNEAREIIQYQEEGKQILQWLRKGSDKEDEPKCRAANHFHNPLLPWEDAMLTDSSWLADLVCDSTSTFKTKYSNLVWATGYIAPDQKLDPPVNTNPYNNGRNWDVARNYFYKSLTLQDPVHREENLAQTFYTLGYILHLLQDMAVPAHTRNDFSQGHSRTIGCPEAGCDEDKLGWIGNLFEGYVRDNFSEIEADIADMNITFTGEKKLTNFWDTETYNPDVSAPATGRDIGLAEYSNGNFLSFATKFRPEFDTEHYFKYPAKSSLAVDINSFPKYSFHDFIAADGKVDKVLHVKKDKDGEVIDNFLALRYLFDHDYSGPAPYYLKYYLDDVCFKNYAKLLLPRAVGYSASLLDYFFRGKMDVEIADGQVTIINRSEEIMEYGNFELYYDTEDGARTAISGSGDTEIVTPILPGGAKTLTLTLPPDFYRCGSDLILTVVFTGKLGNEQNAIAGKIVHGSDCIVIKAGDNMATPFFTVWDPVINAVAEISDPVTGDSIFFPAEYADISNWLAERSTTVTTQAFKWAMENNALKRIGESWQDTDNCSCTVDPDIEATCNDYQQLAVFSHPGCGDFQSYCNYSQTVTSQNGDDAWDTMSEGRVYVDKNFREGILGSYAPIVNTSTGDGETACLRSEWYQKQTIHSYLPPNSLVPYNEWDITQPIKWITPIGEMDLPSESYLGTDDFYSFYNCPSTTTWSVWHRNPPFDGDPIAKPIIYASYSDRVMVQLYFVSSVQWSGTQEEDEFMVNNQRECQVTAYEETYVTNNSLVAASTMNRNGAASLDPRTQPRNPEFENAVRSLVDHTINMQKAAGEITDKDVFQGGINIYIASKTGDGAEGLLRLINDGRADQGLYPLLPDNNLNSAARIHAKDMAMHLSLSHTGSDGSTLQDRVNKTGYTYIVKPGGSSGATEYIANGLSTADDLFTKFRISTSWDTIMNSGYHEMGIGSEIGDDGRRYWCLTFGFNDEH